MAAFSLDEYRSRVQRLRETMAENGMDALLVLSEANICYLTGYEGYSDYVPQAVLVTQRDDPLLILREMDVPCATATCWLPNDRITFYAEEYIGSAERNPWQAIAGTIGPIVKLDRLGVELTANQLGPKSYRILLNALGVQELLDGDGYVNACKRLKSANEIAYIEQAGRIADHAFITGFETIQSGVSQADVAAAIMRALVAGSDGVRGGPPLPPTMPVGHIANAPHLKWTDACYGEGQQTNFELAAFRHRYACALSRTVFLGNASERLRYIHDAVRTGFEAAFQTMRPGMTCGEIDASFRRAFNPFGVRKASRIGYSIGLDWADGGATLQANDPMVLQEDMVFHLIIGVWEPDEGYVLSETLRIGKSGAISMSRVPRSLFTK